MHLRSFALAAAFVLGTIHAGQAEQEPDLDVDSDYRLTFEDQFDEIDVSAWGPGTRWIAHTPWNGDFGDAKFVHPRPGFPFTTKDGILSIEMRKDRNDKWQSGLLASVDRKGQGFSQKYGYFEMRAKFPGGEGVWPAFWLIGLDRLQKGSTSTSEIDIVEYYGRSPGTFSASVHVWPRGEGVKKRSVTERMKVEHNVLTQDYHLYGASVEEDYIRFYLDRKEVWRVPTPPEHRQPMFLLINLGLGAGWAIENTPDPSVMEVDYVRAYARK